MIETAIGLVVLAAIFANYTYNESVTYKPVSFVLWAAFIVLIAVSGR